MELSGRKREHTKASTGQKQADGLGTQLRGLARTRIKACSQDRCDPDKPALHTDWVSADRRARLW